MWRGGSFILRRSRPNSPRKLLQSGLSIEIRDESAMRQVEVSYESMQSMGKENKVHRTMDLSFLV